MEVTLLHNSPLEVVVKAIRKCYASEEKSDSGKFFRGHDDSFKDAKWKLGPKDKALIRHIIKSDHTSTLEHLTFSFDIDGLSRAALQETVRHRHASLSVKSTRYTLGELKEISCSGDTRKDCTSCALNNFLVSTEDDWLDKANLESLCKLHAFIKYDDVPNDKLKYLLPESFKTSLIWTINARSLRNSLKLRSSKGALWEMRALAEEVFKIIPNDMKFIFEDCVEEI